MITAKRTYHTIDDYIKSFPKNIQKILRTVRLTIKKSAPAAEEAISYQIPTFKLNGNLVHFAAYKNHIGFYPGAKAMKIFRNEVTSYKSSKGSVQFPIDKPMPLTLIQKVVEYRVKENFIKASNKKK